jgi:circadian clock protein KaiB
MVKTMVFLKLYIVNYSEKSKETVTRFSKILENYLHGNYKLEILNVMDHPEAAYQDDVLATPTVIKIAPGPSKRIIGDLGDENKILIGLGLVGKQASMA